MTHKYFETKDKKFGSFDFNDLDLNELKKAIQTGIDLGRSNIEKISKNSEPANFENTLVALESSQEDLETTTSVLFLLFSANTNDEVQKMVEDFSPKLAELSNEVLFNENLFKRIKEVYDNQINKLNPEQKRLVEKTYDSFVKNGALLNAADKEKLAKIDIKLSGLSPKFSKNALDATNAFSWKTNDVAKLSGLPDSAIEAAKDAAKDKDLAEDTYFFNLHYPSLLPMLKYNDSRDIREHFYRANSTKAVQGDFSNQPVILEIIKLRDEKAKLLGFENHAEFILSDRMAKNSKKVFSFLNDLEKHCLEKAKKEVAEVKEFAKELDGLKDFKPWDFSYYSEKLRQKRFNISDEEIKPYFVLENVLDGAFTHANKLYGLTFKEINDVSKYHPDVRTFEVTDKNGLIGLFYTDFFPRESKRSGAWCSDFRDQGLFKGKVRRPEVSIVCNFTKPTSTKPSLLTYDEVRTLFHEFGHALHALLSQCTYRSLSGTSVLWDFVELPSQIMENWTLEEESLKLFAKHYKTGEVIPQELVKKLKDSQNFQIGYSYLRQLTFANLDMLWHTTDPVKISNVLDFEKEATKRLQVFEPIEGSNFSCGFGHIFAGGYSAGYYSYKWAEVLEADAFEFFKEKGIFNNDVASAFRKEILEKGNTEDPEILYKNFRGREPSVDALLKRDNLI